MMTVPFSLRVALFTALLCVASGLGMGTKSSVVKIKASVVKIKGDGQIGSYSPLVRWQAEPEFQARKGPDLIACQAGFTCNDGPNDNPSCSCCWTSTSCTTLTATNKADFKCSWVNDAICEPAPIYYIPGDPAIPDSSPGSTYMSAFPYDSGVANSQDYAEISSRLNSLSSGSGVSIYFSATWTGPDGTLLDLGTSFRDSNIVIRSDAGKHFLFRAQYKATTVSAGFSYSDVYIRNIVGSGAAVILLCTISKADGAMRVWRNGDIVMPCNGPESTLISPCTSPSPSPGAPGPSSLFKQQTATYSKSFIGRANRDSTNPSDPDFTGTISSLQIWNQVVNWNQATGTAER